MYVIFNNDYLVVETTNRPKDFAYYATQSLNYKEIDIEQDCVGKIFLNNLFIAAPTPYHTAKKGNWVLTEENLMLMTQVISLATKKVIDLCRLGVALDIVEQVNTISLFGNKTKAYIALKQVLANAPEYCQVSLE